MHLNSHHMIFLFPDHKFWLYMLFGVHKKLFDTFLTYDNCKMENCPCVILIRKLITIFKMKYKIVI